MDITQEYIAKQVLRACLAIIEDERGHNNYSSYVVAVNRKIGRTRNRKMYEVVMKDYNKHGFEFVLDVCRTGRYFMRV